MASSPRASVDEYLASLPADRRDAIATIRKAILRNLPRGYEERLMAGMIAYVVPLSRLPKTYNGQPLMLAALASQKQHMSLWAQLPTGPSGIRAPSACAASSMTTAGRGSTARRSIGRPA